MASNPPGRCCTLGTLHEGEPTGKMVKIDDGKIEAYIATPPDGKAREGKGVIYLPDVFGIWQNSKLMADHFAAQGYTTLIPDFFNGDQLAPSQMTGDFDVMKWMNQGTSGDNPHTAEYIDPIAVKGIKALQDMGINKIGAVGYCFGAKYVVRNFKQGISCGYLAHPSFVTEEELAALPGPLSIAAAEKDSLFPAEKRHESEVILAKTGQPYQIFLYSGTEHGFAVRGDPKVEMQKFAKEQAFLQAVTWFDRFL